MPIVKVPVEHKFGIISHNHKLALQKRLLQQNYKEKDGTLLPQSVQVRGNPLEVSEGFVQKYNLAELKEKEILRDKADKMLLRSKRRCGFSTFGEGSFVDLPLAWSELTVLAQCKGKLQEDCFDILCTSLDQAPVNEENIPTLFFLAESVLYWLQTDISKINYLKTREIKLVEMGQLVFIRLLFHHLSGHLRGLADFKTRLYTYLKGVRRQHLLYETYPSIDLSMRFIGQVGDIVIGPYAALHKNKKNTVESVPESVPALAACVYRTLCVWRCVTHTKVGLKKAILAFLISVHELSAKEWLNGFLALSLLGEAAKLNFTVCRVLQDIGRGLRVRLTAEGDFQTHIDHFPSATVPSTARDVKTPDPLDSKFQAEIDGLMSDFDNIVNAKSQPSPRMAKLTHPEASREASEGKTSPDKKYLKETRIKTKDDAISTNDGIPGIGGWSWESAFQYSQILTDICLNGANAQVQKLALLGKWLDADVTTFRAGAANPCVESCGLVDLLEYRGPSPTDEVLEQHLKKVDWTWKVRYGALSGVSRLTHALRGNDAKVGMRSAAWSLISAMQECPISEDRVLEAIRISQIERAKVPPSDKLTTTNIWSRVAEALSEIYLVAPQGVPQSPLSPTNSKQKAESRLPQTPRSSSAADVKRPTIREELLVHTSVDKSTPDFATRTSLDLKRVLADQWRKEMLQLESEEKEIKVKDLILKRKKEEEMEEEKLRKRKEKLKGKPTAMFGPYEMNLP